MEEISLFHKWCGDTVYIHMQNKARPLPTSYYTQKLTQKWIEDLNIRAKTIKLLQTSIRVNLHDLGLCKGFLDLRQQKKKDEPDSKIKAFVLGGFHSAAVSTSALRAESPGFTPQGEPHRGATWEETPPLRRFSS